MISILPSCRGCGACAENCPTGALKMKNRKAVAARHCVECGVCMRVCPAQAITISGDGTEETAVCSHCPVQCRIPEGCTGACRRYVNRNDSLVRKDMLVMENPQPVLPAEFLWPPLLTGVGAGTEYPCCRSAPQIVQAQRHGVDVVTVVTEAPLSYSGVTVKLDMNTFLSQPGAPVLRRGKPVGLLIAEEYGAQMLQIGGAAHLTGPEGFLTARTIAELANGGEVSVRCGGKELVLRRGAAPAVNGTAQAKMRVGCGSATIGMFATQMKAVCDDVVVLDHHVIGLFSEHLAGAEVGARWSGLRLRADKSSRGRYFGKGGDGVAGTSYENAGDVLAGVDPSHAREGMEVFITDTTGAVREQFRWEHGSFSPMCPSPEALALADTIRANCEDSRVSVLYTGGAGGSARAGVCTHPKALTDLVHMGRARLTVGGAPVNLLPGGGINFTVDSALLPPNAITWVPTPATVAPLEYTMTYADYEAIGGHMERIVSLSSLLPFSVEKAT